MTNVSEGPPLSEETRRRIEEGLKNWKDDKSPARQRFDAAKVVWDQALQPIEDAIVASERLSEDDFAIRINARD